MSKEIAQTVGGKRIAWLLAILAAFAVMATLGTQWNKSDAAMPTTTISLAQSPAGPGSVNPGQTITYTMTTSTTGVNTNGVVIMTVNLPTGVQNATSAVTCPTPAGGVTWAGGGATTGTLTCTSSGVLTAALTNYAMVVTVAAGVSGTVAGTPSGSIADADATPVAATLAGSVGALTINGVAGSVVGTPVAGGNVTFSFSVPNGLTACQDTGDMVGYVPVAADFTIGNGTFVSATAATNADPRVTTVTVAPTAAGNVTATISTHLETEAAAGDNCTASTLVTAVPVVPVLRHIADDGTVIAGQEINSNVRGSTHTICATDGAGNGVILPVGITLSNIVVTNGGGYASTADTDPTFSDVIIDTRTVGGASGTCVTWRSLDAGDQTINILYVGVDGVQYNVLWGSGQGIVKEWNRLEDSEVTLSGGATGTGAGNSTTTPVISKTLSLSLNGSTGTYVGSAVTISDTFRGSHTNSAGVKESVSSLAGVVWTVTRASGSSTCGTLGGTLSGTTTLLTSGAVGGTPSFTFNPAGCTPGQVVTVQIQGDEPGPLGSGVGIRVTQLVRFEFTAQVAAKQVFLAWAGQRVILEHDWRIPAGDQDGGASDSVVELGACPFDQVNRTADEFRVQYVKGSGPGNFLPSFGAVINGSDQATVWVEADDYSQTDTADIIAEPNGSCISRVLYESEDQGQVDIEAFVDRVRSAGTDNVVSESPAGDSTKHAFVIYYMKLNTVTTTLATQFSKPTHNGSSINDWANTSSLTTAPTNPWDASKDDADNAAEWNVSKDLLVRVRVTGWFTNSNPSGRARDDSNPLNVLPADRWVMPNDWALLAGGPADNADGTAATGTAEQFRPYYDIMTSPSNAAGALTSPDGGGYTVVTVVGGISVGTVAAGNSGIGTAGSPIAVTSCTTLVAGRVVVFSDQPTTAMTVASCASNALVLTAPRSSAPAGGVNISANTTGVGSALNPIPVASCTGLTLGTPVVVGATPAGIVASCAGNALVVSAPLATAPAIGTPVLAPTGVPFEGPFSLLDIVGLAPTFGGAALSDSDPNNIRDTAVRDLDVNMWDAPMPPAMVSVAIRGTGFIKQVLKEDVYYLGTPNTASVAAGGTQTYPNPFYISNIPDSPFIPAVAVGGGYLWDTWAFDGPGGAGDRSYRFWRPARIGVNSAGIGDSTLNALDTAELGIIRGIYSDPTIARDLVVYTDNHGEAMVAANGDFKTDLTACQTNVLAGGRHCAPGDKVGTGTITATADYPDFRGKHFPVLSNAAKVDWTWGGYKDVTVEDGETDQFKYIVFHGMDRDGFCRIPTGAVSLHAVLTSADAATDFSSLGARYNSDPAENVDFLIDSGEGIIIGQSGGGTINDGKQFATGVTTYSWAANDPATSGILEFPLSPLAGEGQTDECQAWIKVSNSLLGVINILAIAHDDEGNIGFDRVIDLTNTHSYTLTFRWSLITWVGADAISVNDAITGTGDSGQNPGGNDISASVTAIYGWDAAAQQWLGFFPSGVNVPGANDLTALSTGDAYWVAITGPSSVTWTVASNVN
ncbi:MAG: hypothetical protein AMXMBFR80_15830 [Dehalococcoidia bacterium]